MQKKEHILSLAARRRKAQYAIAKQYVVGQEVIYQLEKTEIISIYPETSPLCGYVLVSGIGLPVLASELMVEKEQKNS